MKNSVRIPVIIISLLFVTGCSNDEEEEAKANAINKQSLIGTWVWQTTQVTDASNQQSGVLNIN